jgi:hypothetical protein
MGLARRALSSSSVKESTPTKRISQGKYGEPHQATSNALETL